MLDLDILHTGLPETV